MQKRIYIHLFSALFFISLFASCRQDAIEHPQLLRADSLMNHRPDSALAILQSIREPAKMRKAERALYALLLTQAKDKNEIRLTGDSLIQTAVNFYDDEKNIYRKAQSLYYLACTYEDMNKIAHSFSALLKAKDLLYKKYKNDRLLYLVHSNLANQYRTQGFYGKAMIAGKESYDNCIARNDSADILYSLDYIASTYLCFGKNDSASIYFNKGLEIARIQHDSSWTASFMGDISEILYNQEKYPEARRYITKAIDYEPEKNDILLYYYYMKGEILNKSGEKDSARHFLSKSAQSDDIYTRYLSNLTLSEIEKEAGNFKRSVEYSEAYALLIDSIYQIDKQAEIVKLLNDHAIASHAQELMLKEKRKTRRIIILCASILVVVTFVYLSIGKHRKNHIIKLQKQLMHNRAEILKASQQKENPGTTIDKESELNTFKRICIKNIQTGKKLFKQNTTYKEIHSIDKLHHKEINFPSRKRNQLKEAIYETFPDALLSLRDLYNLTPDDAYCCILYSLSLSNRTVAACMGVAEGAVKTRKSRIKNKVGEEFYNYMFQSN